MRNERLTAGGRDLHAHLAKIRQSLTAFCDEHELDRIQVARACKGKLQRVSVDFAYAIEKATGGRVKWHVWRSDAGRKAA